MKLRLGQYKGVRSRVREMSKGPCYLRVTFEWVPVETEEPTHRQIYAFRVEGMDGIGLPFDRFESLSGVAHDFVEKRRQEAE